MRLFHLTDYYSNEELSKLNQWLIDSQWYQNIPGGFVTNSPQRLVNAYGDGSQIDNQGNLSGDSISLTHWTAKMNQNNITYTLLI